MSSFNMKNWINNIYASGAKKAFPLMIYPALGHLGFTVKEILCDARLQSECISFLSTCYESAACVTAMDLSVEAEAFGCPILFPENDIPTVTGRLVNNLADAQNLHIPEPGEARTRVSLEAASLASARITDRPVFGCQIGPLSLAGRLCDITSLIVKTRKEPVMVHQLLEKCTRFLIEYAGAFKKSGVSGIIIAEPVAGLLSPPLCQSFSSAYIAAIVEAVQDENFSVMLHNCGNTVKLVPSMLATGAMGLHFGNAVNMKDILPQIPETVLSMGNIDPVGVFRFGNPEKVKMTVKGLLESTHDYRNFIISSGCDIPPGTPLTSIDAFFDAVQDYNGK